MKTKSKKMLPKTAGEITNGGLYRQRIKCGKASCKCAGGEPHTAYYFFTRRSGKLVKFYVQKAALTDLAALVKNAVIERRRRRQAVKSSNAMLSAFRLNLSEHKALLENLKEG